MKNFLQRHKGVHIWAAILALVFGFYRWAISSRAAANTVTAVTSAKGSVISSKPLPLSTTRSPYNRTVASLHNRSLR